MSTYALVPARYGSKGIPHKNHRPLAGGLSPMWRAVECVRAVTDIDTIIVSADCDEAPWNVPDKTGRLRYLRRPDILAQDDTPMLDVVKDAMLSYSGAPDDVWLIVQPTQPLRQPKHLQQAVALLQESQSDSVVSVVELPLTHSPDLVCQITPKGRLYRWGGTWWGAFPNRQAAGRAYIRDGTVYAFWRRNLDGESDFYGVDVRPLIIPASETCSLDTPEDWAEAERRLSR